MHGRSVIHGDIYQVARTREYLEAYDGRSFVCVDRVCDVNMVSNESVVSLHAVEGYVAGGAQIILHHRYGYTASVSIKFSRASNVLSRLLELVQYC